MHCTNTENGNIIYKEDTNASTYVFVNKKAFISIDIILMMVLVYHAILMNIIYVYYIYSLSGIVMTV